MARMIPSAERIIKARKLIQKARDLPAPEGIGDEWFSHVVKVKGIMQDARDLVKFIPYTPTATAEMKEEVAQIFKETEQVEKEILHR
jgi:hypothetical protein